VRQQWLGHYPKGSAALLRGAQALLSLTQHEEGSIRAFFGEDLPPFVRIPNGVEPRFASGDAAAFRSRFGIEGPFAIQVATIDRSKNQLATIQACSPSVSLMIIGRESDPDYAKACRMAAGQNVRFLGTFPHDEPTLADALAAAHLFVLPSYRELFPLSAMEANVAGCHLLLSNRWGGEAIWGKDATFFDPDDRSTMKRELDRLMASPKPEPSRSEAFLAKYSWTAVAAQIRDVYAKALA
jgi:glycosyltransferase involved in cell wall biosynthesis